MNYNTRNADEIVCFRLNITFSKIIIEWNKLDPFTVIIHCYYLLLLFTVIVHCYYPLIIYLSTVILIVRTAKESNTSQTTPWFKSFVRAQIQTIFKILWIYFVCVALILKQMCTFYFTTLCLGIKDTPSRAQLMILIARCQILMIKYWLIFFFLMKLL